MKKILNLCIVFIVSLLTFTSCSKVRYYEYDPTLYQLDKNVVDKYFDVNLNSYVNYSTLYFDVEVKPKKDYTSITTMDASVTFETHSGDMSKTYTVQLDEKGKGNLEKIVIYSIEGDRQFNVVQATGKINFSGDPHDTHNSNFSPETGSTAYIDYHNTRYLAGHDRYGNLIWTPEIVKYKTFYIPDVIYSKSGVPFNINYRYASLAATYRDSLPKYLVIDGEISNPDLLNMIGYDYYKDDKPHKYNRYLAIRKAPYMIDVIDHYHHLGKPIDIYVGLSDEDYQATLNHINKLKDNNIKLHHFEEFPLKDHNQSIK